MLTLTAAAMSAYLRSVDRKAVILASCLQSVIMIMTSSTRAAILHVMALGSCFSNSACSAEDH